MIETSVVEVGAALIRHVPSPSNKPRIKSKVICLLYLIVLDFLGVMPACISHSFVWVWEKPYTLVALVLLKLTVSFPPSHLLYLSICSKSLETSVIKLPKLETQPSAAIYPSQYSDSLVLLNGLCLTILLYVAPLFSFLYLILFIQDGKCYRLCYLPTVVLRVRYIFTINHTSSLQVEILSVVEGFNHYLLLGKLSGYSSLLV